MSASCGGCRRPLTTASGNVRYASDKPPHSEFADPSKARRPLTAASGNVRYASDLGWGRLVLARAV